MTKLVPGKESKDTRFEGAKGKRNAEHEAVRAIRNRLKSVVVRAGVDRERSIRNLAQGCRLQLVKIGGGTAAL